MLEDLHWLPVMKRIVYKRMLLTFKSLNNQEPKYLCDLITRLITIKEPTRQSLSSNSSIVLQRKKINTVNYGERFVSYAAPELCNRLPSRVKNTSTLQQFKTSLKAHLFSEWLYFFPHYVLYCILLFIFFLCICTGHWDLVTECAL